MRLLALDVATVTGWAIFQNGQLIKCGATNGASESSATYPYNIRDKAAAAVGAVIAIIKQQTPDLVVIEDTNIGGRASGYSQRYLEYTHCLLLGELESLGLRSAVSYLTSSEWRKVSGVSVSGDSKANNRRLSLLRAKLKAQLGRKATPKELSEAKRAAGIAGKKTIKHASVLWANSKYGLDLKAGQADIADALGLGTAFLTLQR